MSDTHHTNAVSIAHTHLLQNQRGEIIQTGTQHRDPEGAQHVTHPHCPVLSPLCHMHTLATNLNSQIQIVMSHYPDLLVIS